VDPIASIALVGVTHQNDEDVAWLVNLESQERELVSVGEQGFGFTVREIGPDSVQLAKGGEDYVIRLGDKQIPVNETAPAVASAATGTNGAGGGEGRRGRRQWGGGEATVGGGFGRRGRGNRGNWSGRSFAGNSAGNPPQSSSSGGSDSGSSRGSRQTGVQRRGGGGNFGGFGRMSGFQNAGSGGGTPNQFATGTTGATSNPQTARRRGGQLTGDSEPIERPQAITNPQTQRRLGTSNAGAAFGQSPDAQSQRSRQGGFRTPGQR
jgi:hypothetical protein